MQIKIQPLGNRIIVKPVKAEEKTKAGIIIIDEAKAKPVEGEIMAVGKGIINDNGKVIPLEVKVGDKILYGKYSGTEVKLEKETYLWMKESEVLGIINGGNKQ